MELIDVSLVFYGWIRIESAIKKFQTAKWWLLKDQLKRVLTPINNVENIAEPGNLKCCLADVSIVSSFDTHISKSKNLVQNEIQSDWWNIQLPWSILRDEIIP